MAAESRVDYFRQPHCGDARGRVRNSEIAVQNHSPNSQMPPPTQPQMPFFPRDDERHLSDIQARYHSWQTPQYSVPPHLYPSSEANVAPPMYDGMRLQVPPYMTGATPMLNPAPSSFGANGQQPTPRSRARVDFVVDSSSSNCTPRDHYGVIENTQHKRHKRHNRKHGTPRLPVVKIPDSLKKHGQPSPALYLNSRGFPVRTGKADCKHYKTKGWCAYGTLCKFNHPDSVTMAPTPWPTMTSYGPHSQGMNTPWVGMPPYGWGLWTQQQQQQIYPMLQGVCYPPCGGYSCTVSSPTASSHSSQETANDNEKARDSESVAMYN